MRVPLLLVANPRQVKFGPSVFLRSGNWKIVEEWITTTQFTIHSSTPSSNNVIVGPCVVQVEITNPGDESSISIFAEMINGTIAE